MAAREEDKAMAGLLRRSLAQDAGSGEGCLEPEILAAYFDRALDAQETARYDLHVSRCSVCREQLAAMARAGEAPGEKDAEKKHAGAWDWLAGPGWFVPAAAMLVALLVVAGIAWRVGRPMAPANQIAMSRPDALPPNSTSPGNSLPPPETVPPRKVAPQLEKVPPLGGAPNQPDAVGAPAKPSEFDISRTAGAKPASRAMSQASAAARRDALSPAGAAGAKSSLAQAAPRPQAMARQKNPEMVRGAMRAGSASAARGAPVNSADETSASIEAAPVQNATEAPAMAPAKKTEAGSVESDTDIVVQSDQAKEPNAPKTKLPVTAAAPSRSVSAMNLSANQTTEAAALAKLQQAQISSNLMNLQIHTPDPKILWMIASPGLIEKSENGGTIWKPEYVETRALLLAGAAPTVKICWVVGANGTILRTTNGAHWKTIRPPADADFVRVEAEDALLATVTAIDGRKFSTSDGGKSWSSVP
jgi:hypothetical protein